MSERAFECIATRHGRMLTFANDTGAATSSLRKYGEWAWNELSFLAQFLEAGSTVLDVGAYVGTHTLSFSQMVGPTGRVLSFEPQPATFRLLKLNVRANRAGNVQLTNAAATDLSGSVLADLIDPNQPDSFGSASLAPSPDLDVGAPDRASRCRSRIATMAVDEIGLTACDLIKIDVEGAEHLVLKGAERTIERFAPLIYAECNSVEAGYKTASLLRSFDYNVRLHVVDAFNPQNFRNDLENIFGEAREVALVGESERKALRFPNLRPRPCELVLRAETADDFVLAMLNKPQYPGETLRRTAAAQDGGERWLDDMDRLYPRGGKSRDSRGRGNQEGKRPPDEADDHPNAHSELAFVRTRLVDADSLLRDAQALASQRQSEVETLKVALAETQAASVDHQNRLDAQDAALAHLENVATERLKLAEGLQAALTEVHGLAISRQNELEVINKLVARLQTRVEELELQREEWRERAQTAERGEQDVRALADAALLQSQFAREGRDAAEAALRQADAERMEKEAELERQLVESEERAQAALTEAEAELKWQIADFRRAQAAVNEAEAEGERRLAEAQERAQVAIAEMKAERDRQVEEVRENAQAALRRVEADRDRAEAALRSARAERDRDVRAIQEQAQAAVNEAEAEGERRLAEAQERAQVAIAEMRAERDRQVKEAREKAQAAVNEVQSKLDRQIVEARDRAQAALKEAEADRKMLNEAVATLSAVDAERMRLREKVEQLGTDLEQKESRLARIEQSAWWRLLKPLF